jgi:hypothetical protein
MSNEGKWVSISGVVQFDPEDKTIESSGTEISEFQLRCSGTQRRIKVTLWPELRSIFQSGESPLSVGDAVIIDGNLKTQEGVSKGGDSVTYYNLSAGTIAVIPQVAKSDDSNRPAAAAAASTGGDDAPAW